MVRHNIGQAARDIGADQRQGQQEPENPAPAESLGNEAPRHRPKGRGKAISPRNPGLEFAAFARRHSLADQSLGERQQRATTKALDNARNDQAWQIGRQRAAGTAREENRQRYKQ